MFSFQEVPFRCVSLTPNPLLILYSTFYLGYLSLVLCVKTIMKKFKSRVNIKKRLDKTLIGCIREKDGVLKEGTPR